MKPNKEMEDLHRKVVKKYHTLARMNGLSEEEKKAILASYGVESSSDMQTHDLIDVCGSLQKQLDVKTGAAEAGETMNQLRKRCLRALYDYIDVRGIKTTNRESYIKQLACRSAKKENFNKLTAANLRSVIRYFNSERETMENAKIESGKLQSEQAIIIQGYPTPVGEA